MTLKRKRDDSDKRHKSDKRKRDDSDKRYKSDKRKRDDPDTPIYIYKKSDLSIWNPELYKSMINITTHKFTEIYLDKDTSTIIKQIVNESDMLPTECILAKNLNHPNIVKIYEVFIAPEHYYITMDYYSVGDLIDYIDNNKVIAIDKLSFIISQMISAIKYIHYNQIAHLDIKLNNFFVKDKVPNIVLGDFGLSVRLNDEKITSYAGTLEYIAPEIFKRIPYYGKVADIWSLGVCFYTLLFDKFPFKGNNSCEVLNNIKNKDIFPTHIFDLTQNYNLKSLIKGMLNRDTKKRPTIEDVSLYFSRIVPETGFQK
jgi:serine/threonine protein kinase